MENWNQAYSTHRHGTSSTQRSWRSEFERDWDRIIFSSAFRRLQNKTQVFPLPQEVFVHNRLTHSLEVASVGRSLAEQVGVEMAALPELKLSDDSVEFYKFHLKHVVASACLAHDMGNPAFGHSGEEAISHYFRERANDSAFRQQFSEAEWCDLTHFEGNANALRLLTHQFSGKLDGGFRLTYSTLAAMIKYPCESLASMGKKGPKYRSKYGFFQAEKEVFCDIAERMNLLKEEHSGLVIYKRHPFVYLVEAADDICYSIIDYEDAHRLGVLSSAKVIEDFIRIILLNPQEDANRIHLLLEKVNDNNEKIAFLRAKAINALTLRCAKLFTGNLEALLQGNFAGDLLSADAEVKEAMKPIAQVSVQWIYNHNTVVKIELAGYRIMGALLEDFIDAALSASGQSTLRQRNTLSLMPQQYSFSETASAYQRCMCILDFVSGMTDLYALKLFRNLRGIEMPGMGS